MNQRGIRNTAFLAFSLLFTLTDPGAHAADIVLSSQSLELKFSEQSRTLELADRQTGPILRQGVIRAKLAGKTVASDAPDVAVELADDAGNKTLVLRLSPNALVKARILDPARIELRTEGPIEGPATFTARAAMGNDPRLAILKPQRETDNNVLLTVLGRPQITHATSLFDPQRDLAITAGPAAQVQWQNAQDWELHASAPAGQILATLDLHRNYYRDTLAIRYYAPMPRIARWPTAPVVAMTWYGIEGWGAQPAQRKEWLYPNIDWAAEHLLPYAGPSLVFQLDDNYAVDDKAMREFSDYIRSKGLLPGIWFTPYMIAPASLEKDHPDWFIHDADGKPMGTFGGVNWGGQGQRAGATLNVTNEQAVANHFGMFWKKVSETWNYEFFKIDGQPEVIEAYKKAKDGGGIDGYRKGLAIARSIVGREKFINGCWGIPLEAIGPLNGSRTGGDTGLDPHAINMIIKYNFLNNTAWFCDPDAAANLYKAPIERVRLNAQARVLTGQQFLTDDVWTKVPPDARRVWQLSFPMLDIRPVNLYDIDTWQKYDLFDLRIAKPWATWDIVGLFNYTNQPNTKPLDLARLSLSAPSVHVFEYWKSTYLGRSPRDAKIPRLLAPYEGQLFSVVPAVDDRPALISTSRHASQGGLDLQQLIWKSEGPRWTVTGTSSNLVKSDPYELVFAAGQYDVSAVRSPAGETKVLRGGGVTRVQITPNQSGSVQWTVVFDPATAPRADLIPARLDLLAGATADLEIHNLGPKPVRFKAVASDPRVRLAPDQGQLDPFPATTTIKASVDAPNLDPGSTFDATITLEADAQPPQQSRLTIRQPPPENLALHAKAAASSIWDNGHVASNINDGNESTRWNSRQGDLENSWIELTWDQPVEFDRVLIDECIDWGKRIGAWRLEAGPDHLEIIARGQEMGRNHLVTLPKPIQARKLRLIIEKSSQTPTIWELQVQRWSKKRQ